MEWNSVLAEQCLVLPDSFEQFSLGEPAAALARNEGGRDTSSPCSGTVGAGKLAVTFYLALLAKLASQYSLSLLHRRAAGRSSPINLVANVGKMIRRG